MSFAIESARVFSGAKRVQSPVLNTLGVQVFRAVVARGVYRMRSHAHPLAEQLATQGVVSVDNFLPPGEFAQLREEADRLVTEMPPTTIDQLGPSQVQRYSLQGLDAQLFPALRGWAFDRRPLDIAAAGERRRLRSGDGVRVFERVAYEESEVHDRESDLHVDTFFSTHKLWLYLDDVDEENGPLVYVPGSHKLSMSRLRHDYADSRGKNTGSRRIGEGEVEELGLQPKVLTCPANTLVVVNTCGYHRRSKGQPGRTRRAIHMGFRFNPFLPHFVRSAEPLTRHNPRIARLLDLAVKGQ